MRDGATVFEEGVIKPGVSAELDQHRALAGDARQWIAALEQRERERTGVRGARVGYNKVFGYYLEVSTAQCAQPTDYYQRQGTGAATSASTSSGSGWIRKQTLANAERFVTPELKEMEARVARAHDDALQLERELYNALLERLAERCARAGRHGALRSPCSTWSRRLADSACANGYARPIVDDGDALEIVDGRHPVVEHSLPPGQFVANDTTLGPDARLMLLTGPNMAGKSTYLRQVALIVLHGPGRQLRPGASGAHRHRRSHLHAHRRPRRHRRRPQHVHGRDDRGRDHRALGDRAQPGRARRDRPRHEHVRRHGHRPGDRRGPARRRAPGRRAQDHLRHPLPRADRAGRRRCRGLRTYRVDVLERGDDVVFLHAVVEGGADRSYGVHVARLAGVPERVTRRAALLLRDLEAERDRSAG